MSTNNEDQSLAATEQDSAPAYRPVALKAVIAAALMLKRSATGGNGKKAG